MWNLRNLKVAGWTLFLGILGYLTNQWGIQIPFGITFIFGGIFTGLAIIMLSPQAAIVSTIIASIYTYFLWNHPYALIVLTVESLVVSILYRRTKISVTIIDLFFWTILGIPIVVNVYHLQLGVPVFDALLMALKQAINGVFCISVSAILLDTLSKFVLKNNPEIVARRNLNNFTYQNATFFLLFSMIGATTIFAINYGKEEMKNLAFELLSESEEASKSTKIWLNLHVEVVKSLAAIANDQPQKTSSHLQKQLATFKTNFSDFHNVYLADKNAITYAFYPPTNDLGQSTLALNFADRLYFQKLKETKQVYISDVFMGRGGVFQPVFTIAAPMLNEKGELNGYALGAIRLDKISEVIQNFTKRHSNYVSLLDRNNKIVASTFPGRKTNEVLDFTITDRILTSEWDANIRTPKNKSTSALISDWKNSFYFQITPIQGTEWSILLESPLEPLQSVFFSNLLKLFLFTYGLFLIFLPAIYIVGSRLSQSLTKLSQITNLSRSHPRAIFSSWPESDIFEISELINNFKSAHETISKQQSELEVTNKKLADHLKLKTTELTLAEKKYESLFSQSQAIMLLIDPSDGQILEANRAASDFYGWTLEQLKTMKISQINTLNPEQIKAAMELTLARNHYLFNFEHRTARGEVKQVESYGSTISSNGKTYLFTVIHDVTEKIASQKALDIHKAKLITSERMSHLGVMASGIAHEINNPLAIISGDVSILRRIFTKYPPVGAPDTTKQFDRIEKTIQRINKIIRGLRAFARAGENDPFIPYNVHTLLEETLDLCTQRLSHLNVKMITDFDIAKDLIIECRPSQISQVLVNLINNSVDALSGVPNAEIKMVAKLKHNKQLMLAVEDNGAGISNEVAAKIMTPFFTTKEVGKGTGLGLSISKGIIEDHKGQFYLDRTSPKTRFIIELPIQMSP